MRENMHYQVQHWKPIEGCLRTQETSTITGPLKAGFHMRLDPFAVCRKRVALCSSVLLWSFATRAPIPFSPPDCLIKVPPLNWHNSPEAISKIQRYSVLQGRAVKSTVLFPPSSCWPALQHKAKMQGTACIEGNYVCVCVYSFVQA